MQRWFESNPGSHYKTIRSQMNQNTQDFIAGIDLAIKIAKEEREKILSESANLVVAGNLPDSMEDIDTLDAQAFAIQGVIFKLQQQIFDAKHITKKLL